MNFTYTLIKPSDGQWGVLKNGIWTGMIGALDRRLIDIGNIYLVLNRGIIFLWKSFKKLLFTLSCYIFVAPVPFGVTFARGQVISFSNLINTDHYKLFIRNPDTTINFQSYSEPLHYISWSVIGIFCLILPPFLVAAI